MIISAKNKTSTLSGMAALALMISSAGVYPAAADECSQMIEQVTEASGTANLTVEENSLIENARDSALAKQAAGDTAGCMADLGEARILLNLG